jgi:hypothetical protein
MVTSRIPKLLVVGDHGKHESLLEFIHIVTFFLFQCVYCLLQVNSFCLLFMKELATLQCWCFLMFLFVYVSRGVSSAFGCALFVEGDFMMWRMQ